MRPRSIMIVVMLAAAARASPARADTATAEALFREGKQLMAEGKYELACQKLSDSYRADPATGALLATALCYDKAGKTASAWAAYTEVIARARTEHQPEREKAARDRIAALEPKLSRLSIEVDPDSAKLPGFVVLRNGEAWARGAWNTAVPVDPGSYSIEARADGYRAWRMNVNVKADADRVSLRVPKLAPSGAARTNAPSNASHEASGDSVAKDRRAESRAPLRTWGYVVGGVGLVGVGIGSYFGLKAISKNDESESDCDGNVCGPAGTKARNAARTNGMISTVAFVAGGALLAGGVTLYVLGGKQKGSEARLSLSGQAGWGQAHAVLGGTF